MLLKKIIWFAGIVAFALSVVASISMLFAHEGSLAYMCIKMFRDVSIGWVCVAISFRVGLYTCTYSKAARRSYLKTEYRIFYGIGLLCMYIGYLVTSRGVFAFLIGKSPAWSTFGKIACAEIPMTIGIFATATYLIGKHQLHKRAFI